MPQDNEARRISSCLQLAILLEASSHKPGNVSVVTNFDGTCYEHFLASAVAAAPSFEKAASKGIEVSTGEDRLADVGVGRLIKECVVDIGGWQHGGNTLLGTVILLMPIAVAAGITIAEGAFNIQRLRDKLGLVVKSTLPEDAVDVYEAIRIANPGGLGKAQKLDVNDPNSISQLRTEKTSLFDVFKIAEKYDTVCAEWVNNYPVTFDLAYPSLQKGLEKRNDIGAAIINTFLQVLAKVPDTFIARKTSFETAFEVSYKAQKILELGGPETFQGRESLSEFDRELRKSSNLLNPGTTADIIAAALSLCVLGGYRP